MLFGIKREFDMTRILKNTNLELCENISSSRTHVTVDLKDYQKHLNSFVKSAIIRNGFKM